MTTKINLEYFGMPGSGATVKEAKADAGRKIEKALSGSYTPSILSAGDDTVILWRDPSCGWSYGFLRDGKISVIHSGNGDKKDVERAARSHLGANATDWRTCFSADDVHPVVLDQRDRREIAGNCRWQRQMDACKVVGLNDNDSRYLIGGMTQFLTSPVPAGFDVHAIA